MNKQPNKTKSFYKSGMNIFNPIKSIVFLRNKERRILISMIMENGLQNIFYVFYTNSTFIHNEKMYIVDIDSLYWNDEHQCMTAIYYENFSIPIAIQNYKKEISIKVQHKLSQSNVYMNTNATILHQTVKSEMIQKVMRGEELEQFLLTVKRLQLFILIGVVVLIILIGGRFV